MTCYERLHRTRGFWDMQASLHDDEKHYVTCMNNARQILSSCLVHIQGRCERAKVHSAKLVRLRMPTVNKLLSRDPEVKVIYLLRDPRAVLNSRHRDSRQKIPDMVSDSAVLCPTMVTDFKAKSKIARDFAASILTLKYEDVVFDPDRSVLAIYEHLSLKTPRSVRRWFKESMADGEKRPGGSTTRKKEPRDIAMRWKKDLSNDTMARINNNCAEAIRLLGYSL